jgi:hypothetical protein
VFLAMILPAEQIGPQSEASAHVLPANPPRLFVRVLMPGVLAVFLVVLVPTSRLAVLIGATL